jgi:hypothetical protein
VLEALLCEAPAFQLLVWPHRAVAPPPWTLERFRGQRVALLLDDLHEFANPTEAALVLAAAEKLQSVCARLIVVATCRAGTDCDAVERDFAVLLQRLTPLVVEPMERESAESAAFVSRMKEAQVELHLRSFDGTPGSALPDLDRRTLQPDHRAGTRLRQHAGRLPFLSPLARAARYYAHQRDKVNRCAVVHSRKGVSLFVACILWYKPYTWREEPDSHTSSVAKSLAHSSYVLGMCAHMPGH